MYQEINHIVWEEGQFFVALSFKPEISSFGDTKEEALTNLKEALELYFEDSF